MAGGGNATVEGTLSLTNLEIEMIWGSVVAEVIGGDDSTRIVAIDSEHLPSDAIRRLALRGLFVAIGHGSGRLRFLPASW